MANTMKNAIITVSDENCSEFLINHWLKSLKANVRLAGTDVVVLDYGLSKQHVSELKKEKVIVVRCVRDGFPAVIRLHDMHSLLKKRKYGQVMMCDGGDIIFQSDISGLFSKDKGKFRAVCESVTSGGFGKLFLKGCFSPALQKKIQATITGKKMINAGLIIGPYEKFKRMCGQGAKSIHRKVFGPDQVFINYFLYKNGFVQLSEEYNFVPPTAASGFKIRNGVFYFDLGRKIAVVHNAGGVNLFRIIDNFGFGAERNRVNKVKAYFLNKIIRLIHIRK
jgi:hypothetical protein